MTIRFATFNASLNRDTEGKLITDLSTPENAQAQAIAEIIQRSNPDVVLVNEFDYDATGTAAALFQENYLALSQNGVDPVEYPYVYAAPSNTGIPSGLDLNNNGSIGGPDDAYGFGVFPGQFAFVIYSKYPIVEDQIRTFQEFLWADMPGALLPADPTDADGNGDTANWFTPEELAAVRLSSKNHVDLPIEVNGEIIHILASHPTPPVFDGPEDRNGRRNYDEIRFWADYIQGEDYIYDDNGAAGGLAAGAKFVIMGDQNSDPFDGDSIPGAAQQILENPLVNTTVTPTSAGGPDASERQGLNNLTQTGDPAFDTADFGEDTFGGPGNLRVDYVLPSYNQTITDAGVFWLPDEDPLFDRLNGDFPFPTSDHRLVYVDVAVPGADSGRRTVADLEFLGEVILPTDPTFVGTQVGGLSGLTYDAEAGLYYAISDDRSQLSPARFYTLGIDLSDGRLDEGDVAVADVTTLLDASGNPFAAQSIDPEAIALTPDGTLYIASEGVASTGIAPFVNEFSLAGQQLSELPIDAKFLSAAASGIRPNLAFESLTLSPDGRYLYTATENALFQDGPAASLEEGSLSRIVKYDLANDEAIAEYVYEVEPIPTAPVPADAFSDNGLVELLAIDNNGSFLALERSFAEGQGNTVKLYEVRSQGKLDVQGVFDLFREEALEEDGDVIPPGPFEIDPAVSKREILDIEADLGIAPDNLEALTFGPTLADGRQTLIIASDNNFSDTQSTQFLAFAVDFDTIPAVPSVLETPLTVDDEDGTTPLLGDSDDPAIWVNASNPNDSRVIVTLKDGGAATFNLQGELQQTILPADYGDIRYNNVDLLYGVEVPAFNPTGSFTTDIAVMSDRANDTLAIFGIDAATGELYDLTAPTLSDPAFSIFGVDDGEATAYGLATYLSPVTGKLYAFVTQASGNQVAQLELLPQVSPADASYIDARVVRIIDLPVPTGDVEDSQSEGLVVDQELGQLYVTLENEVGILRFDAEPNGGSNFSLVQAIDADFLEPDIEGLTIYYGAEGTGYLIASSQGNNSFAVFSREGDNEYLGSFTVGDTGLIDQVNESDGLDVTNVALGSAFPNGLVVVQDGANDPQNVIEDGEQLENNSTNFKFVDWAVVANAFEVALDIDTESFDPRDPDSLVELDTLPNGVASGDVTQDSVVLWTRSTVTGDVTFEYSTSNDFASLAGTVTATVTDGTIPVKVEVDGLEAGTDYYYRVTDASGNTKPGQFETAAAVGEYAGLRFGVSGDWRGELAPYPAIANADEQDLAFFVEHGDTIYADYPSPAVPNPQTVTLEEYRAKHGEVYGDRFNTNTWSDLRASTAIYATIDDHEVIDDFSGGETIGSDPRLLEAFPGDDPNALVNDSTLFENGLQVFQEYNPIRDEFYGETGDDRTANERKLYRADTFGSDAATFVLDTRSFRDAPLVAPDITNPADVGRFLVESATLDRQFLGDVQLADLKADLVSAQENGVTWKFVMVPEPIQELGIYSVDAFEGYAKERTEILKFVEENGIDNVVFVAADIHGTFVNNLTYTDVVGGPRVATDVWEITTGSVAFDPAFGPAVIDFATVAGLIPPEQRAFYDALPIASDTDDLLNDKDDFLKFAFQSLVIGPGGYDPIGLNTNLTAEQGLIGSFDVEANLLQGDYVAAHTFGWTQFDIDPETQVLTVTTYGIEAYTEAELLADPAAILSRVPAIVSQFEVLPTLAEPAALAELIDLTGVDGDVALNVTADREAAFDNVLKFYTTDAQGRVEGLLPGEAGYEAAVAANLLDAELFVENNSSTDGDLILAGGGYYAPALLINGSVTNLATIEDAALGNVRIKREGDVWGFEDLTDNDFNDLVVTLNSAEAVVA